MSSDINGGKGYSGFIRPETGLGKFNSTTFLIQSILARVRTSQIVQVMAVHPGNGFAGFVDLQPMVAQVDGNNNAVPHGTIFQCPYFRLQGGTNAVIIDPAIGDIGFAVFADRDISAAVSAQALANPGSNRMFDMADAVYIGGFINQTPVQLIEFTPTGITITSPNAVTVNSATAVVNATQTASVVAPTVNINASSQTNINSPSTIISGNLTVQGTMTA